MYNSVASQTLARRRGEESGYLVVTGDIQYASKKSVRTEPVSTAQLLLKSTVKYGVLLVRCGESTE